MFELDGAENSVFCENLAYISKLFLDHKTLEYDMTPFMFYVLCEIYDDQYHITGYFSKVLSFWFRKKSQNTTTIYLVFLSSLSTSEKATASFSLILATSSVWSKRKWVPHSVLSQISEEPAIYLGGLRESLSTSEDTLENLSAPVTSLKRLWSEKRIFSGPWRRKGWSNTLEEQSTCA